MDEKKVKKTRTRVTSVIPRNSMSVGSSRKKKRTWEQGSEEFLCWKKAQGVSETTLKGYSNHISHFFKRFGDIWTDEVEAKAATMVHLSDDIMPATYNLRLIYLRAFFDWSNSEEYVLVNPFNGFKKRKADPRIVDIPIDTLQKLLSLPDQKTFAGLRDYALILFTLDTGVRPNEAFQLTAKDYDLLHFSVTIPAKVSKTRQSRKLPILSNTAEVIKKLIRVRPDDWGKETYKC